MTTDCVAPFWHREGADIILAVHVQPGARRNAAIGVHGGRIKIAVSAPARDGSANARLLAWLAQQCAVPVSRLELIQGAGSRTKRIRMRQAPAHVDRLFALWDVPT
ncbi:MAG TPA: DUF167 domain-containing protein [Candidatus Macondimonas sp.]|nr:DUF167 domain-containing protein [Candidatus Macondimonas sp.]